MIIAGLWLPYDAQSSDRGGSPPALVRAPAAAGARVTMDDFEPFLASALRRPIEVVAPPSPPSAPEDSAPPPAPEPPPEIQLLGTITEPHNSYAAFDTRDGVELKRVGDTIGGAQVVEIGEGVAVTRQPDGQSLRFFVPSPTPAPPSSSSPPDEP